MATQAPFSPHVSSVLPSQPTGANVLCLHGLFAGGWVFDDLLPRIAERGYPAHAVSFRGHPPNPPRADIGGMSMTDFVNDATTVARNLDRPIVIGHSLGGLIAMLLAADNLVRAAVLVAAAPSRGIAALSPKLLLRMARHLPSLLFSRKLEPTAADVDALVLNCVPEAERAAIRDRFVADSGRAARQAAIGVYKVNPRDVRVPLLVVGAEHDQFMPCKVAAKIARKYGAPLHVAEGHGHFLFAEPGWKRQVDVILDWIDALPPVIRQQSDDIAENSGVSPRITLPHLDQTGAT